MRKAITIILAVLAAVGVQAQNTAKFDYDVNFEYDFDNREFDAGGNLYTNSMTINAARLSPVAGLKLREYKKLQHRIMLGIDIMKNMGESPTGNADIALNNTGLFREMLLYYSILANTGSTRIEGYAGLFPRRFSESGNSNEFLSDSLEFFDNNIEGVLLKIKRPKSLYEFSCDWLGQFGSNRRERFILSSYGNSNLNDWLSAGWMISYYHLANMEEYGGVVDNVLAQPYVRFGFEAFAPLQELSLKLSWLQGMQRERLVSDNFDFPLGGQIDFKVMNWNVGIENKAYIGKSLMPYYNNIDAGGNKYGNLLYRGDPFYRLVPKGGDVNAIGFYDRLEVFYQPHISNYLDLRLSFLCHFAEGSSGNIAYAGCRQRLSLIFNLDKFRNREMSRRKQNSRRRTIRIYGGQYL